MTTKLEEIARKAQQESKVRFTSIAHHITRELIWENLKQIDPKTTPGVDGVKPKEAIATYQSWIEIMIQKIHHKGYKPPHVKRVWIPKPGKQAKRPIGIPCVVDRALQKSTSIVLSAIYEQDFLNCSYGGRPGKSAHQALATLNEIMMGKKVNWVYEADLKNYFGSLDHTWLMKFVEHRIGDPRIISLIRRWLKAGILEDEKVTIPETGVPQGGSISVLLSNIYLHYVLDLWFEKIIKPSLKGEAYLIRYIDDFVVCFQYQEEALHFQEELQKRLAKFSLTLEPSKTQLIEFGRFAQAKGKKIETLYFLGFTHYCTRNRKGKFMLGRKSEKSRLRRSMQKIKELLNEVMHFSIKEQVGKINQYLRGHYNYYALGGNSKALRRVYYFTIHGWRKTLSRRSQKGRVTWEKLLKLIKLNPIVKPWIKLPYERMGKMANL
jgi:RNA-directed DNA polymerase